MAAGADCRAGETYLVARKIMQPVAELDRAAAEIAKQNYDYRINVYSQDELGALGETFQSMCESIRAAREELIRRERIATIGQLSTSIVHDLRNPLAAIYAGAEMLVDSNLPEEHDAASGQKHLSGFAWDSGHAAGVVGRGARKIERQRDVQLARSDRAPPGIRWRRWRRRAESS